MTDSSLPPPAQTLVHRYELDLPDGDHRTAKVWWCEQTEVDGILTHKLSIDVQKAQSLNPLTDDEIKAATGSSDVYWAHSKLFIIAIFKAAEAAHGIKDAA